jgi:hypothetical protein
MTERVSEDTPLAEAPSSDPLQPEHDASGQVRITTERSGSPSTPRSPQGSDSLPDFTANNSRREPAETGLLQPGQHHFTSTGAAGVEDPVRHPSTFYFLSAMLSQYLRLFPLFLSFNLYRGTSLKTAMPFFHALSPANFMVSFKPQRRNIPAMLLLCYQSVC